MIKNTLLAGSVAAMALTGAANAAVYDLAFIMDESGSVGATNYTNSMDALADALEASLTTAVLGQDQYNITVISFANGTVVDSTPMLVSNTTNLAAVTANIRAATHSGGFTNYEAAFDTLFNTAGAFSANADGSIINMMTDGEPCLSGNCPVNPTTDIEAARTALRTQGWDALSFEAVTDPNGNAPDSAFLASLAFDTGGVGGAMIIDDPDDINDPLNEAFVLEVSGFGAAYNSAIASKIARIVDPDPVSPVPVPAGLPLLLGGLGVFGFIARRRRKSA